MWTAILKAFASAIGLATFVLNCQPSSAREIQSTHPNPIAGNKELLPYCQELRYANRYCRRKDRQWECTEHMVVNLPNSEYPIDFRPTCTKWDIEKVQSFCEVWTDAGLVWYYDVKNTVYGKSSALDAILKSWKRDGRVTLEGGYASEPMFLCLQKKDDPSAPK